MRPSLVIACALIAGTASAQGTSRRSGAPQAARPQAAAPAAPPAAAPAAPPAAAPAEAKPAGTEKLEAAADNIARMRIALRLVLGRAEQARNEKDVVKLNCVNEKLTQMKALLKVGEQADVALREAVMTRGGGEAESSKLAIARTKVDRLRRESEQCVGQLAFMVDERTTVEFEQPANLPGRGSPGLGVAHRGENPADAVGEIGLAEPTPPCGGLGAPFCPPPVVRPPAASQYR